METIYRAFDGKLFERYDDCYDYEAKIIHKNLFTIDFYDEQTGKLFNILPNEIFNDKTYWRAGKVHIHNEEELKDLLWLAKECGWCEFEEQINSPGFWERTTPNGKGFNAVWVDAVWVNKEIKGE